MIPRQPRCEQGRADEKEGERGEPLGGRVRIGAFDDDGEDLADRPLLCVGECSAHRRPICFTQHSDGSVSRTASEGANDESGEKDREEQRPGEPDDSPEIGAPALRCRPVPARLQEKDSQIASQDATIKKQDSQIQSLMDKLKAFQKGGAPGLPAGLPSGGASERPTGIPSGGSSDAPPKAPSGNTSPVPSGGVPEAPSGGPSGLPTGSGSGGLGGLKGLMK